MNSSLMISESIFVDVADDDTTFNTFSDYCMDSSHGNSSVVTKLPEETVSKKSDVPSIQMTHEEAMRLLNLAATLLQVNIKGYLQRTKYHKMLSEHKSATRIQALWRGYAVRNCNKRVRELFKYELVIRLLQQQVVDKDIYHAEKMRKVLENQKVIAAFVKNLAADFSASKRKKSSQERQTELSAAIQLDDRVVTPEQNVDDSMKTVESEIVPVVLSDKICSDSIEKLPITENQAPDDGIHVEIEDALQDDILNENDIKLVVD